MGLIAIFVRRHSSVPFVELRSEYLFTFVHLDSLTFLCSLTDLDFVQSSFIPSRVCVLALQRPQDWSHMSRRPRSGETLLHQHRYDVETYCQRRFGITHVIIHTSPSNSFRFSEPKSPLKQTGLRLRNLQNCLQMTPPVNPSRWSYINLKDAIKETPDGMSCGRTV